MTKTSGYPTKEEGNMAEKILKASERKAYKNNFVKIQTDFQETILNNTCLSRYRLP